jgi:hypothetical protein
MLTGTGPGPYNIYYRDASNGGGLVFYEGPLTLNELYSTRIITVPDTTQTITIKNINPACKALIKDVDIAINPAATPTPSITATTTVTPTQTITPTLTQTPGLSPTATPTNTPTTTPEVTSTPAFTPTPQLSSTPVPTATQTPTPSTPLVAVQVSLTIDSGNAGYTRIYKYNGSTTTLLTTLSSPGFTTVFIPAGQQYFVQTILLARQFSTDVAQINNYINGTPDICSPYIQPSLNTILELNCPAQYSPNVYPTVFYGNNYVVNTFLGSIRPV